MTMPQIEHRAIGEIREEDGGKLIGYAAVFNKRSKDLGGFVEVIEPGAFRDAISAGADIKALWNHDSNIVLGRTLSGTLSIAEDDTGLKVEITPPEKGIARDYAEMVLRGDVSQMSFAFSVRSDGQRFEELEDGTILRTLTSLDLFEVSPVTFPAYPDTTIAKRAMEEMTRNEVNHAPLKAKMMLGFIDRSIHTAFTNHKGE